MMLMSRWRRPLWRIVRRVWFFDRRSRGCRNSTNRKRDSESNDGVDAEATMRTKHINSPVSSCWLSSLLYTDRWMLTTRCSVNGRLRKCKGWWGSTSRQHRSDTFQNTSRPNWDSHGSEKKEMWRATIFAFSFWLFLRLLNTEPTRKWLTSFAGRQPFGFARIYGLLTRPCRFDTAQQSRLQ